MRNKKEELREKLIKEGKRPDDFVDVVLQQDYENQKLKAKTAEKMKGIYEDYKKMVTEQKSSDKQTVLDNKDFKLLAINGAKLTKTEILKMHVKNYAELGLKQRRQVYEKIQNTKALHARNIFLKELNVIGWQFKNKTINPNADKAKLEQLS